MACGIASTIRRNSCSSCRSLNSARFRSSMSRSVPYHLTTFPFSSRSGTFRPKNHRYSPFACRTRNSDSIGCPTAKAVRQFSTDRSRSSGWVTFIQPQPLLARKGRVIQPALTYEINAAIRECSANKGRYSFDSEAKFALVLQNSLFRLLGGRDVHDGTNKLDLTRIIPQSLGHNVDMFHGSVRHQQPMFKMEILSVL